MKTAHFISKTSFNGPFILSGFYCSRFYDSQSIKSEQFPVFIATTDGVESNKIPKKKTDCLTLTAIEFVKFLRFEITCILSSTMESVSTFLCLQFNVRVNAIATTMFMF